MLEDYEPVSARLDRWLKVHADHECRVVTDLVHYLQDHCVFRAELWLDGVMIATGWAEEVRGQGNVNRTSHLENCETSAVGRALANAGMAGSDFTKRPSREEMAKVSRLSTGSQGGVDRKFTGTKTIVNKMKGRCVNCQGEVEIGEGLAKNDGSGWKTYHHDGACVTVEDPF